MAGAAAAILEGRFAIAVVRGAFLFIRQDVVGAAEFLEFLFRFFVTRIAIRVILHGQLAKRLFQVVLAGVPPDTQHFI